MLFSRIFFLLVLVSLLSSTCVCIALVGCYMLFGFATPHCWRVCVFSSFYFPLGFFQFSPPLCTRPLQFTPQFEQRARLPSGMWLAWNRGGVTHVEKGEHRRSYAFERMRGSLLLYDRCCCCFCASVCTFQNVVEIVQAVFPRMSHPRTHSGTVLGCHKGETLRLLLYRGCRQVSSLEDGVIQIQQGQAAEQSGKNTSTKLKFHLSSC